MVIAIVIHNNEICSIYLVTQQITDRVVGGNQLELLHLYSL